MKKVAIVTVNYNTAADTKNFLKSLAKAKTSGLTLETIVIDNGSKDALVLDTDQVTLLRNEKNAGFTGGYNLGIAKAMADGADYLLIVNNDTTMDPDLIHNLLKPFENDAKIGLTVPKIYFAKGHEFHKDRYSKDELGKVFWYAGGKMDWAHVKSIHRGVDEVDHGQYDKSESITFATGCCMMIKREVIEKVGFFDEDFFLYYEDADLSERILRAGYSIYYIPEAVLVHINAGSSGGAGNHLQDYFLTRNQMLFGMRYAPLRTKIALIRQSIRLLFNGRPNQKKAIRDFYLRRFDEGTFFVN